MLFNDALNTFYVGSMEGRKFNDALDTFYLHLYGVRPVVERWLEREIAQWVNSMKDRSDDPRTMSERFHWEGESIM